MECLNAAGWNCELFDERRIDRYRLVIFQKVYDDASFLVAEKLKRLGAKTLFRSLRQSLLHSRRKAGTTRTGGTFAANGRYGRFPVGLDDGIEKTISGKTSHRY